MSELVDATDIDQWAPRRDAQGRLPQLVRRLIVESASIIQHLDFPAGEGVQRRGWDGIAEVSGAERFVPDGLSLWELGTSGDPGRKAEEDYQSRIDDPLGFDPATATYVAVTARRWPGKRDWVESKADGPWKEVLAFDADDLALWLEGCPATHSWLSIILGKDPQDAKALTTWWESWASGTNPPISTELVLAGREVQGSAFVKRVSESARIITITADSPDEAIAFATASLMADDEIETEQLLIRATVVTNAVGWTRVVAAQRPAVLIPIYQGADVSAAVAAGHRVVIPTSGPVNGDGEVLDPGRVRRSAARDALREMGVPETDVEQAAAIARRSLMSLRRRLGIAPHLETPTWSEPTEAPGLVPALLAGVWDETRDGDRDVVARLGGTVEEVVRTLTRWANEPDPPVRRVGSTWMLVSKEDAWRQLARHLRAEDLERLQQAVRSVLGAPDPRLDLPEEERWMAAIRGVIPPHSGVLRRGLTDTVALIAARSGDQQLANGLSGQEFADVMVNELLRAANDDDTGRVWTSLSDVLPLLAEAAPDVFLQAVDVGTSGDDPVVMRMFTDSETTNPLFSSATHSGLLWALEVVAWSPPYVGRAALILARLSRLDPGGTWANRPANSLRETFLPWLPQTAASLEERLAVLDMLLEREPEVAVDLLANLLPHMHDSATPNHPPEWRDWRVEPPDPPVGWTETVEHITRRLIEVAATEAQVWLKLVDGMASLPTPLQDEVLDALSATEPEAMDSATRAAVSEAVRAEAARHRTFADARWAMPEEQVERLEALYEHLAPDDAVSTSVWLFGHHPDLPERADRDWDAYQQTLEDLRRTAIVEVVDAGGLHAVEELARQVDVPFAVGNALGQTALPPEDEDMLFGWMNPDDEVLRLVARGYVVARFAAEGWPWADATLNQKKEEWAPAQRAEFLFGLPMTGETWDRADGLGDETVAAYWSGFWRVILPDPSEHERAARALVEHGRLFTAIELLGSYVDRVETPMSPQLIAEVLEAAATTPASDSPNHTMLQYHVARLLDAIEASGEVEQRVIARLEWLYLGVLRHGDRPSRLLHRQLAEDPPFFAEVITWIFKAEDEEREVTEESRAKAEAGFHLLESWKGLPGLTEDGGIDEAALRDWVMAARESIHESGRGVIGDQRIGSVLRCSPNGSDGAWPHEAVRSIIEDLASEYIERGMEIQVYNSRGITSRGVYEGGDQERELAQQYRDWADATQARWPRTAAMLRRIAESYERDARRHDTDAERDEDL